MTTPLDDNNNPSPLSDAVAWQFYQDFAPSAAALLWAGRPVLRRAYWVRMGVLMFFTVSTSGLVLYGWQAVSSSTLINSLVTVLSISIFLWNIVMIMGGIRLTRKIQCSYYAFDEEHLYTYNKVEDKMQTFSLAALPDFVAQPHKDGTTTLRGKTRFSKHSTGKTYKTPVLYCLPNGKAVLEHLHPIQQQAQLRAAQKAATPSWLPQD